MQYLNKVNKQYRNNILSTNSSQECPDPPATPVTRTYLLLTSSYRRNANELTNEGISVTFFFHKFWHSLLQAALSGPRSKNIFQL